MADESAQKNGAKWLMVVLIVSAVFAFLFILGYTTNSYKRDGPEKSNSSLEVNA